MGSIRQATQAVEKAQAELDRLIDSFSSDVVLSKSWSAPESSGAKRMPVYVIVSSKDRLTQKFGHDGFDQIDRDLRELKQAIKDHTDLNTILVYVDDGYSLDPFRIPPIDPADPTQVKTLIDMLDGHLNGQDQVIQYVLIVGGNSIVPFHHLPNPVDDQDRNVPSDNPYASRDENHLIPERAVGRMPDGENGNPSFLRSLIRTAIDAHLTPVAGKGLLDSFVDLFWSMEPEPGNGDGQGYSASIWRRASRAVFETIGDNRHLRTSPPLTYEEFKLAHGPHLSYFNLHGIEDGANWYGQRDALFPADYPLFPVALRPDDLTPVEHANSVVFTEACYGANVIGKDPDTSIALRFLASRALALVGSTNISYGSIAPPLMGADLVGRHFWEGLTARLSIGEALKYAKVKLAKEMQDRQGYLDGEDQKTLLSFVMYGDPSLPATAIHTGAMKTFSSKGMVPSVVCQRAQVQKGLVSDELVAKVKGRIETRLPYMTQAQAQAAPLKLCSESCDDGCGRGHSHHAPRTSRRPVRNWSLTLAKDLPIEGDGKHRQLIKVTADEHGHIIKMAMSK